MRHTFVFYAHTGTDNKQGPLTLLHDLARRGIVQTREAILVSTDDDAAAARLQAAANPGSIILATVLPGEEGN